MHILSKLFEITESVYTCYQLVPSTALLLIVIMLLYEANDYPVSDCNSDSSVCQLGFCKNTWSWLGMGRCHLDLQYCLLFPTRRDEVRHPLHLEWKSLA